MYMMTRSKKSLIPLIKLSEGFSINEDKKPFVTLVAGSNGEKLNPIRVWKEPYVFFDKEKLNAEFVSKSELVYVKAKLDKAGNEVYIDIVKYKIPTYLQGNTEIEYDVIRKTKPETEQILSVSIPYNDVKNRKKNTHILDFTEMICDGKFNDVILYALDKLENPEQLCYYKNRSE